MKDRDDRNNHANQMNPNNDAYWQARGYNERPNDWKTWWIKRNRRRVPERRRDAPRAQR